MRYLVCDNCGGYYELQEGESPEDFESCECGGQLKFTENIGSEIEGGFQSEFFSPKSKRNILNSWNKEMPILVIVLIFTFLTGYVIVDNLYDNFVLTNNTQLTDEELEAYKALCNEVNVTELINNPEKYK